LATPTATPDSQPKSPEKAFGIRDIAGDPSPKRGAQDDNAEGRTQKEKEDRNNPFPAKISTALDDSRHFPKMAIDLLICCNTGAISCVPDEISTIYWGAVLTAMTPNRKVSTSQLGDAAAFGGSVGRWNHLSKHLPLILEMPPFIAHLNRRTSVVEIPSSLAIGECCA
jgi:hypothetical protein